MALLTINQSPTIADQILFNIATPGADNCFTSDPYMVKRVTIYFIEREFAALNPLQYNQEIEKPDLVAQLATAQAAACAAPTQDNLNLVQQIQSQIDSTATINTFYFKKAIPVQVFGTDDYPAWLSTDTGNAILTHTGTGKFELVWEPVGMREGDYFICWQWFPNPAGQPLSQNLLFTLLGASQLTTAIPTHVTDPNKYYTLQERYLPEMFKMAISNNDLTPQVISEFNNSVADGFTFLENQANAIFDLLDANAIPEGLLVYLANIFNLRLRSTDPTLWRRQIKDAISLFKQKGTLQGLQNAFADAGMTLNSITRLWQVVSPYTFQELFDVINSNQFTLSRNIILPLDTTNFELYFRGVDDTTWTTLNSTYVSISGNTLTWTSNIITLTPGDSIRVVYEIVDVPPSFQATENYIRSLPLADQRDERVEECPLKNWNVRVIAENDPLFDVVIPSRHPFANPVIFGKIRTEFPYSENIYNMDEYNGSLRDSDQPCDIDKNFLDPCSQCQGSKFNADVTITDLTNDRILEVQDIFQEFMPFHAVLQTLNFTGNMNDFQQQTEEINSIIKYFGQENCLAGEGGIVFSRTMIATNQLKRTALANSTVVANDTGIAYNNSIILFYPLDYLDELGIDTASNLLEVLAPSANAGQYTIASTSGRTAVVSGSIAQPLHESQFTFRLSNEILNTSSAQITKSNINEIADVNVNYSLLGAKTLWDVAHTANYSGNAWKISSVTLGGTFQIAEVLPNNVLLLNDPGHILPTGSITNLHYSLLDDNNNLITSSTTGNYTVQFQAIVDLSLSVAVPDIRTLISIGNYVLYSGTQYLVTGFVTGQAHQLYIGGYNSGNVAGATLTVFNRLLDNAIGQFAYDGLSLHTTTNYESSLDIMNGENPPATVLDNSLFFEDFLVLIGTTYYAITGINGTTINLGGPFQNWKTFSAGGTSISFSILHFIKQPITIPASTYPDIPQEQFAYIDRRGQEIISYTIGSSTPMYLMALNSKDEGQPIDVQTQSESIKFHIKYNDGTETEGQINA